MFGEAGGDFVIEAGVIAGYLIDRAVRKARRAAGRLDCEADAVVEAGLDELHEAVAARLGSGPALAELSDLALTDPGEGVAGREGRIGESARRHLESAIAAAAREDGEFRRSLRGMVLELATDPIRHDRMLDLTGGDAAALAEITAAQDILLADPEPDLLALARLSIRRSDLAERNRYLPVELPAVWAALGRPDRAEALARSVVESHLALSQRDRMVTELALALVAAGEVDRAVSLAKILPNPAVPAAKTAELVRAVATAGDLDGAEALAGTFTDSGRRTWAMAALAPVVAAGGDLDRAQAIVRALSIPGARHHALGGLAETIAAAGDVDRAEALAGTITSTYNKEWALAALAPLVATAGDLDRAQAIAGTITNPCTKATALAALARAAARGGDTASARRLATAGETAATAGTNPYWQAPALAELIGAMAAAGDRDGVVRLAGTAETVARTIRSQFLRPVRLTEIARAVAAAGDPNRAEAIARTIAQPDHRTAALAEVIRAAAGTDAGRVERLAGAAEAVARTITNTYLQADALIGLMRAVAAAGDPDRAESIAAAITVPERRAQALALLALVVAAADRGRAERLAAAAGTAAHTIDNFYKQYTRAKELIGLIRAVATAGDLHRARQLSAVAERVARAVTDTYYRTYALVELASAVAATADTDRVGAIADTITSPPAWAQAKLATAVAVAGDPDRAEILAQAITIPDMRVQALADLVAAAAGSGEPERARRLAGAAENIARSIPRGQGLGTNPRGHGLAAAARALAKAGDLGRANAAARDTDAVLEDPYALLEVVAAEDLDRAETIAHTIRQPNERTKVLAHLALTAAGRGHRDHARRLTADAERTVGDVTSPGLRSEALAALVPAMAALGDLDRAERICGLLTEPGQRASALTEIVEFADPPRAHRLLGKAFATGSWLVPLPVLAKLQPHMAVQLADERARALTARPT